MGRYAKELVHVYNGSGAVSGAQYTAPSGTFAGTARCARATQVVIANQTAGTATYALTHTSTTPHFSRYVIPSTTIPAFGSKIYNVNVSMKAGDTLDVDLTTGCTMMVTGEEYLLGSGGSVPLVAYGVGNGTQATVFTGGTGTLPGELRCGRVSWINMHNSGTSQTAFKVWANGEPLISDSVLVGSNKSYNVNLPVNYNFTVDIQCPSTMSYTVSGEMYIIGT